MLSSHQTIALRVSKLIKLSNLLSTANRKPQTISRKHYHHHGDCDHQQNFFHDCLFLFVILMFNKDKVTKLFCIADDFAT